jgi:metal-responsive CopG/Arc/MetJ family transcriptional regulator
MPHKVLIALPAAMLEQVDFIATEEHRSRSDLIREAIRRYADNFRNKQTPEFNARYFGPNRASSAVVSCEPALETLPS